MINTNLRLEELTADHQASLLLFAALHNNGPLIEKLGNHFRVTSDTRGITPLDVALHMNHFTAANALIKIGAKLNRRDDQGNTLLHRETTLGHPDHIETLLKYDLDLTIKNYDGMTPLDIAIQKNPLFFAEKLLEAAELKNAPTPLDHQDFQGNTILHLAATQQNLDVTKLLLRHHIDPTIQNYLGLTAQDIADKAEHYNDHLFNLLYNANTHWHQNHTDVKYTFNQNSKELFSAIDRNDLAIVTALLYQGYTSPNVRDPNRALKTPLMVAVEKMRLNVITLLVKNNAYITLPDQTFQNPLTVAYKFSRWDIVSALLEGKLAFPLDYINHLIRQCQSQLIPENSLKDQHTNTKTIDRFASQLVNMDFHLKFLDPIKVKLSTLRTKTNHEKYYCQLQSLNCTTGIPGADFTTTNVYASGWNSHKFLPLRIRHHFALLVTKPKSLQTLANPSDIHKTLKHMLISEIETLRTHLFATAFRSLANPFIKTKLLRSLAGNIERSILNLGHNEQHSLRSGCLSHAVYINTKRERRHSTIHVHNFGLFVNQYHKDSFSRWKRTAKPKLIARLPYSGHDKLCGYIEDTLKSTTMKCDNNAAEKIYSNAFKDTLRGATNRWPSFPLQVVGNCVVYNHNSQMFYWLDNKVLYGHLIRIEVKHTMRVISKNPSFTNTATQHSASPAAQMYATAGNQHDYGQRNAVEFYATPSIDSHSKKSNFAYQPTLPNRPYQNLNGSLMLAKIGVDWGKKAWHSVKQLWSAEDTATLEEKLTALPTAPDIQTLKEKLQTIKAKQQTLENTLPKNDCRWTRWMWEDFCDDLSQLRRKGKCANLALHELNEDIEALRKDIDQKLTRSQENTQTHTLNQHHMLGK